MRETDQGAAEPGQGAQTPGKAETAGSWAGLHMIVQALLYFVTFCPNFVPNPEGLRMQ